MEAVLDKSGEDYLIKLPGDLVSSLRWRPGEKLEVEISEWKGRIVLVVYRKSL